MQLIGALVGVCFVTLLFWAFGFGFDTRGSVLGLYVLSSAVGALFGAWLAEIERGQ